MTKLIDLLPKRIREYQDALIGVGVSWLVGVPLFALAGFYIGTIVGNNWYADPSFDYQPKDMVNGGIGALVGLGVGIVFAIVVTAIYPKAVESDALKRHHHGH